MPSVTARLLLTAATVGALFVPAPARAGDDGSGPGGVSAPGCRARYLVPPNPLNSTFGMALDGKGGLYVIQGVYNRIVRVDLAHPGNVTVIADETDAEPLQFPDDMALGPDGNLYVTELLSRKVTRLSLDGKQRTVVGTNIGDGASGANGIAFDARGRLFATDLTFDPSHPGGL